MPAATAGAGRYGAGSVQHRRGRHGASSVARVSTASSRAHAAQAREVTPGLSASPWGAAERAAVWEQRWDRVGQERQRSEHWGHVPVRPTAVRPAWVSVPDDHIESTGVTAAIGQYDRAAYARQEKEDAAFLAANERRKRDVLVAELARLQAEVDSLDRQVYEAGEARRFAGRLFHDESQHSQIGACGRASHCIPGLLFSLRAAAPFRLLLRRCFGLCCGEPGSAPSATLAGARGCSLGLAPTRPSTSDGPVLLLFAT